MNLFLDAAATLPASFAGGDLWTMLHEAASLPEDLRAVVSQRIHGGQSLLDLGDRKAAMVVAAAMAEAQGLCPIASVKAFGLG
ncbi:MAG: hypothetical protein ACKVK6_08905 [bacterium]|tara:strand:+ start:2437 stop:2685 length:249 start_codon:yes stop_codon:yes gene_type:complete